VHKPESTDAAAFASDAGATGFKNAMAGDTAMREMRGAQPLSFAGSGRLLAVAFAVLVLMFGAYDGLRGYDDLSARLDISAQLLASELNQAGISDAATVLGFLVGKVPQSASVYLTDNKGQLLAATGQADFTDQSFSRAAVNDNAILAEADVTGDLGAIYVASPLIASIVPTLQRTALAAIIASLLWAAIMRWIIPGQTTMSSIEGRGLRELIDTLPFGIAHWSEDGQLVSCNDHYRNRLRLNKGDTKSGRDYVVTMARVTDGNSCRSVSESETGRLTEIQREDGSCVLIDERPLREGGFVTLVTDVSEQKEVEKQLDVIREQQRMLTQQLHEEKLKAEAASRAKTSFLAHLSHDIRTPLNHIIGFADLIVHQTYGPVGDKRYVNYVNDIKSSGEKLLESFAEILELSQLEGGHLILRRENFDVAELVTTISNRFKEPAQRAGVTFDISLPSNTNLYADRICVERMLGNIVENAIRYTPSGGRVRLAAWSAQDGTVFEISDTGIGISPDRIDDLSQPFVLGDAAFSREGGVGLGISISRAIAELSGGELEIDSSPAVGTTVAISLPDRAKLSARLSNAA